MRYRIKYGLGGGFGGLRNCDWEEIDTDTLEHAWEWAEESARDVYESYAGSNGLFNEREALEDNPELTEEDLMDMYQEDVDSWIVYIAEEVK